MQLVAHPGQGFDLAAQPREGLVALRPDPGLARLRLAQLAAQRSEIRRLLRRGVLRLCPRCVGLGRLPVQRPGGLVDPVLQRRDLAAPALCQRDLLGQPCPHPIQFGLLSAAAVACASSCRPSASA